MNRFFTHMLAAAIAFAPAGVDLKPDEHAELRKKLEDLLDYTKNTSDVCPVHGVKMAVKSVPVTYGLNAADMDGLRQFIEKEFPFSRENISGGCIESNDPSEPTAGKRFVCPQCVAGWERWWERATNKSAEPYGGTHEVTATQGTVTFHHVHQWDSAKLAPLFSDIEHHDRYFSKANDFSYVEVRDGPTLLFRSPAPALTHLWISPDGQYFVGLSSIKDRNPYQLVVWQRDGKLRHHEHIAREVAKLSPEQRREFAERFPKAEQFLSDRCLTNGTGTYLDYFSVEVTDAFGLAVWDYLYPFRVRHPYGDDFLESFSQVDWFDSESPDLSISQSGGAMSLSLRSRLGKRMTIPINQ